MIISALAAWADFRPPFRMHESDSIPPVMGEPCRISIQTRHQTGQPTCLGALVAAASPLAVQLSMGDGPVADSFSRSVLQVAKKR
jgi:hypothetical protein